MTTENTSPIETLRDGAIKATIWENQGEKGTFYSVELSRTYQTTEGQYRDSHSFSGTDLLKVSELAKKAYETVNDLRKVERDATE